MSSGLPRSSAWLTQQLVERSGDEGPGRKRGQPLSALAALDGRCAVTFARVCVRADLHVAVDMLDMHPSQTAAAALLLQVPFFLHVTRALAGSKSTVSAS